MIRFESGVFGVEQGIFIAIAVMFLTLAYVFRRSKKMRVPYVILGLVFAVFAGANAT